MNTKDIIDTVALIGIGGLLKSAFDYFYVEKRKRKDQSRHEFKELRYKAILILCHSLLDYETSIEKLSNHRPDIQSKEELIKEIELEWFNMALYASDTVILATKKFILSNSHENLTNMILAMRRSLYDIKSSLSFQDFTL
ncbi:hypothetical protein [Chryseobacterium sp. MMS23-Vi53]|uniref:hypothetical protein n=1 Tax=Chryseobacterium sp. MMS23-Vi53 TaxID=3386644 RepID=UPI0039E97C3B